MVYYLHSDCMVHYLHSDCMVIICIRIVWCIDCIRIVWCIVCIRIVCYITFIRSIIRFVTVCFRRSIICCSTTRSSHLRPLYPSCPSRLLILLLFRHGNQSLSQTTLLTKLMHADGSVPTLNELVPYRVHYCTDGYGSRLITSILQCKPNAHYDLFTLEPIPAVGIEMAKPVVKISEGWWWSRWWFPLFSCRHLSVH